MFYSEGKQMDVSSLKLGIPLIEQVIFVGASINTFDRGGSLENTLKPAFLLHVNALNIWKLTYEYNCNERWIIDVRAEHDFDISENVSVSPMSLLRQERYNGQDKFLWMLNGAIKFKLK